MKQSINEEWRSIEGYEGLYEVSNLGFVRSLDRITPDGRSIKGRVLKFGYAKGYPEVNLSKNGIAIGARVHRLVADAFIPNPDNLSCINHKDENPKNNRVDNLEWCTYKHNNNYGTCISRRIAKENKRIIAVNVKTGKETEYPSMRECCRSGGFNMGGIHKVMLQKQPIHKGHVFYYPDDPDWINTHRKNILYGAIYAISITDGSRLDFKNMEETAKSGFLPPSVSKALKRENNTYKNYRWYFK